MSKHVGGASAKGSSATIPGVIIGVLLLVAFVAPLRNELRFAIFPQDEGLLLVYPSRILDGAIPNRTFDSVYGVVNLWIIAAAFKVFGTTLVVERCVGIAYRLVLAASLVVLSWRRRGPAAGGAAGVMCIVVLAGTLGLGAFSWLGALAACSVGFLMIDIGLGSRRRPAVLAAAGLALGLAVGFRLDMGIAVLLVVAVLSWFRRSAVRWLLVGVAGGLVPLLFNVLQAGPGSVLRDQLFDPVFASGPARRLPLTTLTWQELTLLGLCVVVALASCVVGLVGVRSDRSAWSPLLLLTIGVFEVGILAQAFQRSDALHLAYVACFVLPSGVLIPSPVWARWPERVVSSGPPLLLGVVVLGLAGTGFADTYWSAATSSPSVPEAQVKNDGRSVILGSEADVKDLEPILKDLDRLAGPGDRLFVGPSDLRTANYNDTFIYFMAPHLVPGSYYLEMNPGVANAVNSRLADDLRGDEFLILSNRWNKLPGQSSTPVLGPDLPNQIVASQFEPVRASGPWTLYRRTTG